MACLDGTLYQVSPGAAGPAAAFAAGTPAHLVERATNYFWLSPVHPGKAPPFVPRRGPSLCSLPPCSPSPSIAAPARPHPRQAAACTDGATQLEHRADDQPGLAGLLLARRFLPMAEPPRARAWASSR